MRAGPAQKRGGALVCGRKHFWALIFLVLFASRQNVQNKKVRTPLNSCEALADQIQRLTVSLFTVVDIEKLEALAKKHVYCWLWVERWNCAACNTYALCVVDFNARMQKNFWLYTSSLTGAQDCVH
ncbi:MAG: hypothetical protein ACK4RF_04440 [Cyclobacteriaceae bacterium]